MRLIANEELSMVAGGEAEIDWSTGSGDGGVGGGGGGDGGITLQLSYSLANSPFQVTGSFVDGASTAINNCIQGGKDIAGLEVVVTGVTGQPEFGAGVVAAGCLIETGYGIYSGF